MTIVNVVLIALLTGFFSLGQAGYVQPAPSKSADQPITTAEQLLDRLDEAEQDLHDFSAKMRYTKEQGLLGDVQERTGQLFFLNESGTRGRKFRVEFRSLRLGDTVENESKDFIFDGHWLVERLNDERQFIKREVVREGETYDPLSVDGPFPLPIGQSKSDVLERFDATLLPAETDGRLAGFYKLMLKPKEGVRLGSGGELLEESIADLTLWYDPGTLLPWQVVLNEENGDVKTVKLAEVKVNGGVEASLFDTTTPGPDDGWNVTVERFDQKK